MSGDRPASPRRSDSGGSEILSAAAHELRGSLNGIRTWTHVLETRLGESRDPAVRRAIEGIATAVQQQVRVIEKLLECSGVEPSLRRAAMARRNDAKPDVPDDAPREDRAKRPDSAPDTMEGPGGRRTPKAEQDARNKTTRQGER